MEVFIFSLFGYVWLIFKYPKVLISLPLLGLGFLSFIGGMRFGMYAVPILSLGFGYALTSSCRAFEQKLQGERSAKLMSMTIAVIVIMYALIPHIGYVASFRPSTVVDGNEVKLINNANVKEDDYILGWWDNGYVLKYFTRANVTIDGRKFQGSQTFPFSFALFTDQESASRMLLLDVAYEQKRREMAKQKQPKDGKKISSSNFIWMMIDRGYENPNEFLKDLKKQSVEPQSDVYLYLPYAMLDFVPNILLFSNLDLMSGEKYQEPFYFFSPYAIAGDRIYFIDGVSYEDGKIYHEDRSWSIGKIISVINKEISSEDIGDGSLVWVRFEGGNLFVDESRLDETYIQLLVFGNVDGRFFELVSENSAGKIYKVKR